MANVLERADVIAADRQRGASLLLADLLPVLDDAVAEGREVTTEVVRRICKGQTSMASLWNICAAAVTDFESPGRYQRRRAEMARGQRALVRAATAALQHALIDAPHARVLTLSYSGSVADTLAALAATHRLEVVCAESMPGGEGAALVQRLRSAGLDSRVVLDATLATYLRTADAVVVGADALASSHWTNKVGTFGIAAAAWFSGVPVYVISTRDKAVSPMLVEHLRLADMFENTPSQLSTLFLTDAGAMPPEGLPDLCDRFSSDAAALLVALSQ